MPRPLFAALLALLASGCMVGPDYVRPPLDAPAGWRLNEQDARDLANTAWWEQFADPVLNDLVATALRENKDLLIATARVEEFAGNYGFVRSGLFPQIGASADARRQRDVGAVVLGAGQDNTFSTYNVILNASWEIDLWGTHPAPDRSRAAQPAGQRGRQARRHPVAGRQRHRRLHQPARPRPATRDRPGDGQEPRRVVRTLQAALRRRPHLGARAEPEPLTV
jgi:multidrug efflux system outer membrane protein